MKLIKLILSGLFLLTLACKKEAGNLLEGKIYKIYLYDSIDVLYDSLVHYYNSNGLLYKYKSTQRIAEISRMGDSVFLSTTFFDVNGFDSSTSTHIACLNNQNYIDKILYISPQNQRKLERLYRRNVTGILENVIIDTIGDSSRITDIEYIGGNYTRYKSTIYFSFPFPPFGISSSTDWHNATYTNLSRNMIPYYSQFPGFIDNEFNNFNYIHAKPNTNLIQSYFSDDGMNDTIKFNYIQNTLGLISETHYFRNSRYQGKGKYIYH